MPPEDELWLFVDTVTGVPARPEMHNERWHRVRAFGRAERSRERVAPDDRLPEPAAPRRDKVVPPAVGRAVEVVAMYLGDKLTTVLNLDQDLSGEDALRQTVNKLETL